MSLAPEAWKALLPVLQGLLTAEAKRRLGLPSRSALSRWADGFTTIFETPGLGLSARRRARAAGPRAVAMRSDHQRLLGSAGFSDSTEVDLTPSFRATAAAWLAESEVHADELARLEPPGAFAQRQIERRAMLAAIDAGLLRRALVVARRE